MPRITKEAKSDDEKIIKKKAATTKKTTVKKEAENKTKKATTTKKTATKKESESKAKKTTTKKEASSNEKVKKETAKKSTSTTKKVTAAKKAATKKVAEDKPKKTTTKTTKAAKETKSTTTKKSTAKKSATKVKTASPEDFSIAEYYDLPYNYNKTVVKLLAQTPNTLFVYWEISDEDRKKYAEQYGNNFFEVTKPVLIVHNISNNYSFEVDINDFANCWYLNVNDSQCEYKIELGRRPIKNNNYDNSNKINEDYIYVSSSNGIEAPNNRILFDPNQKMAYFRNVKTNEVTSKSISLSYMKNMGKIYNIYDIYKEIYKDENIEEFDLSNPSSKGNPSSTFK